MPGYNLTPEELQLKEVYGEWVYANAGDHLLKGIAENVVW